MRLRADQGDGGGRARPKNPKSAGFHSLGLTLLQDTPDRFGGREQRNRPRAGFAWTPRPALKDPACDRRRREKSWVRGENVMQGYWRRPRRRPGVVESEDGKARWMATASRHLDDKGRIVITNARRM